MNGSPALLALRGASSLVGGLALVSALACSAPMTTYSPADVAGVGAPDVGDAADSLGPEGAQDSLDPEGAADSLDPEGGTDTPRSADGGDTSGSKDATGGLDPDDAGGGLDPDDAAGGLEPDDAAALPGPGDASDALVPEDTEIPACPWLSPVAVGPEGVTLEAALPGLCPLTLTLPSPAVVAFEVTQGSLSGVPVDAPGWSAPRLLPAGPITLTIAPESEAPAHVRVLNLGAPPGPVDRAKSLVWSEAPLVDVCGLACLMAALAEDGHGGQLLHDWFLRFSTTPHSERFGPALLLEQIAAAQGVDPSGWDLDLLPFRVTGVHNRLDLRNAAHCGELRVSLASVDPLLKPFHLLFLFALPPRLDDAAPDGSLHCTATALAWARLSELPDEQRVPASQALAAASFTAQHFLAAESLEFMVAPWEWRQWFFSATEPQVLENRPLFQTVDLPRVNAPGPDREAFLAYVTANADALRERRAEVPEAFRSPSGRLNQGVPWEPLDLSGLPASVGDLTSLRQAVEQVGCVGCHTADAPFVQTNEDREFSPFYDKELDARLDALEASAVGPTPKTPFGPLQSPFVAH